MNKQPKHSATVVVEQETAEKLTEMAAYYQLPVWAVVKEVTNVLYSGHYEEQRQAYVEHVNFERYVKDNH